MPRKAAEKPAVPRKTHPAYGPLIASAHGDLIRKHRTGYTSSTVYFYLLKKYATVRRASIVPALRRMEAKGFASNEGGRWKVTQAGLASKKKKKTTRKRRVVAKNGDVAKRLSKKAGKDAKAKVAAEKPKKARGEKKKKVIPKKVGGEKPKKAGREKKKEAGKGRGRSASPKGGRAAKPEVAARAPKKVARQKTAALADDSNPNPADPRAQKAKVSFDNLAGVEYKWQYEDHGWRDYDKKASELVEGHWTEFQADPHSFDVRAIRSGDWEYQVDFKSMTQTNVVHPAHTVRKLRRVIA